MVKYFPKYGMKELQILVMKLLAYIYQTSDITGLISKGHISVINDMTMPVILVMDTLVYLIKIMAEVGLIKMQIYLKVNITIL